VKGDLCINIGIIGCGFAGLANATLLSHGNNIFLWDISQDKLKTIKNNFIPFDDKSIIEEWNSKKYNFNIWDSKSDLINNSKIVILALPTDLDIYQ